MSDKSAARVGAWVEIDLGRLRANARAVRRLAAGRRVIAVVKANAYGHGAVPAARAFAAAGIDAFAVFRPDEAAELRAAGIDTPILQLGPGDPAGALDAGAVVSVHSLESAAALAAEAARRGEVVPYHLKIDTGIGRLGVPARELPAFLKALAALRGLRMEGFFTHLACADDPSHPLTARQIEAFQAALAQARGAGHSPSQVHLANSAALLRGLAPDLGAVRVGLALYGYSPAPEAFPGDGLLPALSLRSVVAQIKEIPAGTSLGYGATWIAPRPSRIATLACGYNEGYPRALSNQGEVLIRGRRHPVVGRVSMDLVTVDISDDPAIAVGDVATLLGEDGAERLGAWEVARRAGTIAWDILCGTDRRLPRRYLEGGDGAGSR